ncbi:Hypothetical_protein [Hexamita inflata]|uniref:Hypothetical_protein n=1 Tax=Hexamita inflata TaxID=28002 RepID=A0ABP1KJW6_9EUKA
MLKDHKQLRLSISQIGSNKARVSFSQISQMRTPKLNKCKTHFEPNLEPKLMLLNNDNKLQELPLFKCNQQLEDIVQINSYESDYKIDSARLGAELKKLNESLGINYDNELKEIIKNNIIGLNFIIGRINDLLILCNSHIQTVDNIRTTQGYIISQSVQWQ